ncbi:hypothetical protein PFTANZ_00046 [Plasmodium falciparum Tanzania (2000708)]|uniref:Uncharacterized protein n=1 Tax=Plasmodium falciparum Tanzania (2000708) TaxID=1036725 RepID=A0A024WF96_PLAFA|nr:hypothetical protein PFTANZ_00046 [Plasmodium falciparum Tanzania (2000708)]
MSHINYNVEKRKSLKKHNNNNNNNNIYNNKIDTPNIKNYDDSSKHINTNPQVLDSILLSNMEKDKKLKLLNNYINMFDKNKNDKVTTNHPSHNIYNRKNNDTYDDQDKDEQYVDTDDSFSLSNTKKKINKRDIISYDNYIFEDEDKVSSKYLEYKNDSTSHMKKKKDEGSNRKGNINMDSNNNDDNNNNINMKSNTNNNNNNNNNKDDDYYDDNNYYHKNHSDSINNSINNSINYNDIHRKEKKNKKNTHNEKKYISNMYNFQYDDYDKKKKKKIH